MTRAIDPLARAVARPLLIEKAVRTSLRDAIAWRIGGGSAPNSDAFAAAAVAYARQVLDAVGTDGAERSRTLSAAQRVAKQFANSKLGHRLMAVPPSQFVRLATTPDGPDAIVRDRRRHLHAIILKLRAQPLDAGRTATTVASATALPISDRLTPLTVHIFSLTTQRRHTFERELTGPAPASRVA